jgi:hypothetical protein
MELLGCAGTDFNAVVPGVFRSFFRSNTLSAKALRENISPLFHRLFR